MLYYRNLAKNVDIDVLLALDYITSMQYFRLFRWNSDGLANGTMQLQLKAIADSQQLLWTNPEAANEYLSGLKIAAEKVQPGLYKAVCAMLKSPIRTAVDQKARAQASMDDAAAEHWLDEAYQELRHQAHGLPDWPQTYNKQEDCTWDDFSISALKVWLHCKMDAEADNHLVGSHSAERMKQFTQTDRIVKSLLNLETEADDEMNSEDLEGKPDGISRKCSVCIVEQHVCLSKPVMQPAIVSLSYAL